MPNRPPAKLTPTDLRKVKKVATGPLLGPVPIPPRRKAEKTSAKSAPLGTFTSVKSRLDGILAPDASAP